MSANIVTVRYEGGIGKENTPADAMMMCFRPMCPLKKFLGRPVPWWRRVEENGQLNYLPPSPIKAQKAIPLPTYFFPYIHIPAHANTPNKTIPVHGTTKHGPLIPDMTLYHNIAFPLNVLEQWERRSHRHDHDSSITPLPFHTWAMSISLPQEWPSMNMILQWPNHIWACHFPQSPPWPYHAFGKSLTQFSFDSPHMTHTHTIQHPLRFQPFPPSFQGSCPQLLASWDRAGEEEGRTKTHTRLWP